MRVALRDQDFARILGAGLLLIIVGTVTYTLGNGWSLVDGFYVAVATLTTSSILDPSLTFTDGWLKVFTALYVLVGIGILVEVARPPRHGLHRRSGRTGGGQEGQDDGSFRPRHTDLRPWYDPLTGWP